MDTTNAINNRVITIYKKRGQTPLEALEELQEKQPELQSEPLSYAGRLDPMAEGALLVLVGDENKKREKYLRLEKEYIFDVLFGFSTDTYDILGKLINSLTKSTQKRVSTKAVLDVIDSWRKKTRQEYPPYSSKTVDGKPLFEYAREGKLNQIEIPQHDIEIFEGALMGMRTTTSEQLWNQIDSEINKVSGDFRQKEIRDCWWEHLRPLYGEKFDIATITVRCSSGVYVRSLANELGEKLGVPALALKIVRTKVGKYAVNK